MFAQLNPWIPLVTDDGRKGHAIALIDYGQEHDTLFLFGFDDTRELWWLPNSRLRIADNISLGRHPQ